MANKTPLAAWLYSKRDELNPRFKEFSLSNRILPGLHDFSTTLSWDGTEAKGRGVDSSREIALEKSVAEAIERLICKSLGFDSVGFAIGSTYDPIDHASHEALERFYLKKHLKEKIPFHQIFLESIDTKKFRNLNPESELSFYKMQTPKELFGLVCSMKVTSGGATAFGFALSNSLEKSIQRSLLEALPNFAWLTDENKKSDVELPWHIDSKFLSQIEPLLVCDIDADDFRTDIPMLKRVHVDHSQILILSSAPIQTARFVAETADGQ